jgi:predicted dehydrogenase
MTSQLKVGVLGVGLMGERHARVLRSMPEAELVGVYDSDCDRAQLVGARYGVPALPSLEALIDQAEAVAIATPTPQHYEHVRACLLADRHVLVEKSITERVEQAEELAELARARRLLLMVGHIERYNPVFSELKRILGERGQPPFAISFRRLSSYATSSRVVDVALDLMIHDADLLLDLCRGQPITALSAAGRVVRSSEIDHAVAHLSLRDGPVCSLFASRVTEQKVRAIEVTTPDSFIVADLLRKEIFVHRHTLATYQAQDGGITYQQQTVVDQVQVASTEPLLLEAQDFVRCAQTGSPPRVSAEEATAALRLVHDVSSLIRADLERRMA